MSAGQRLGVAEPACSAGWRRALPLGPVRGGTEPTGHRGCSHGPRAGPRAPTESAPLPHAFPPTRWLPSKARDLDISPYGSPRAASPEVQLPLTVFATAARSTAPASTGAPSGAASGFAVSEAGSGSITPAFSGDDASPRAVLRSASARLLDHQAAARSGSYDVGQSAPPGPPNLVRKSLLTSSLAPGRRSCSPDAPPSRVASLGLPPAPQPSSSIATAVARAAAAPRLAAQPQPVVTPTLVQHAGSAMSYRVAGEWQQPAIRTVKMQGQARAH